MPWAYRLGLGVSKEPGLLAPPREGWWVHTPKLGQLNHKHDVRRDAMNATPSKSAAGRVRCRSTLVHLDAPM
jgi:hypothetical protein